MGRFASTVGLYEELRPPYPPAFFATVAQNLNLSKQHALIDLGTGPGLLALGFGAYVGRITGVDPEPEMLAAARAAAARQGQALTLIEGRAEDLGAEIGRFDLVTIGRALHWMDEAALGPLFRRLAAADGVIAVCASFPAQDGRNAWLDAYSTARRAWSDPKLWTESRRGERAHRELASVLTGSGFHAAETIAVETAHEVGVARLARRLLTFSSSSPAALGDRMDAMLADVEQRLSRFAREGTLTEVVVSTAQIARRD
ncbi:class I SAM-dependent methyltransferase [Bradyrhizobium sp.]|uniref:class I SAM-dependent methyltransferase n=1 Tax=Bradyrhizobium sp. TaxID=376 RepID=UPI0025BF65AD|nr:class I SAM-dependent methyltransferase [Bradyrhizobium sp.]MBV8921554.1 class I SAM-dependent methyltransferase [Bradyrhizobium sp.]